MQSHTVPYKVAAAHALSVRSIYIVTILLEYTTIHDDHRCVTPSSLRCRNRLRPRLRLLLSSRKRRHRSLRTSRKKRKEKLAEFWSAFLPIVTISLPWQIELRHYRLVSQRHCLHQKRKENGATTHGVLREFASHLCWRCWCPPGQLRQRLRDTQTVCVRYLLCPLLCCVALSCIVLRCVVLCYVMLCCVVLCCVVLLCCLVLCCVVLRCVMLCYVMLCYVMLCYVVLCCCAVLCCLVLCCVVLRCVVLLGCVVLCAGVGRSGGVSQWSAHRRWVGSNGSS